MILEVECNVLSVISLTCGSLGLINIALWNAQENSISTWDQPQWLRRVVVFLEIITTGWAKRQVPDLVPCFVAVFWTLRYNLTEYEVVTSQFTGGSKCPLFQWEMNKPGNKKASAPRVSILNLPWVLFVCHLLVNLLKVSAYIIYIVDHITLFVFIRISSWRYLLKFYNLGFKYLEKNNM